VFKGQQFAELNKYYKTFLQQYKHCIGIICVLLYKCKTKRRRYYGYRKRNYKYKRKKQES